MPGGVVICGGLQEDAEVLDERGHDLIDSGMAMIKHSKGASSERSEELKKCGKESIESGKAKVASAKEAMNERSAEWNEMGEDLVQSGRSAVAHGAEAVKNAVEPPEPTLCGKAAGKLDDVVQSVKKATVG